MKMKNLLSRTLLAAAGATLIAQAAQAGTTTYTAGDLMLGFRQSAGPASQDLVLDIGNFSTYANASSPFAVSGLSSADVSAVFGSLNNVQWGVVGALGFAGSGGQPGDTLWMGRGRADASTQSTPWTTGSASAQGTASAKIQSIGNGYKGQTSTANSSTAVIQTGSASTSYSTFIASKNNSGIGNLQDTFQGNVEQTTPSSFSSGFSYEDLYQMNPNTGGAKFLGYFQLGSDSSLEFVPVPEPSTYGLVAGAGLLALCLRNQLRRKQA